MNKVGKAVIAAVLVETAVVHGAMLIGYIVSKRRGHSLWADAQKIAEQPVINDQQ